MLLANFIVEVFKFQMLNFVYAFLVKHKFDMRVPILFLSLFKFGCCEVACLKPFYHGCVFTNVYKYIINNSLVIYLLTFVKVLMVRS